MPHDPLPSPRVCPYCGSHPSTQTFIRKPEPGHYQCKNKFCDSRGREQMILLVVEQEEL